MYSDEHENLSIRKIFGRAPFVAQTHNEASRALAQPLGTPFLSESLRPDTQITIVFDPAEEACPNEIIVPALLDELRSARVPYEHITLLLAHNFRQSTEQGAAAPGLDWLNPALRERTIQHDPYNVQAVNQLGVVQRVPLSVNFHAVEADFLIATGAMTPHKQASFTGSAFNVSIGCAGIETINELFTAEFETNDEARDLADASGTLSNPVARIVQETAARAGLCFSLECSDARQPDFAVRAGAPLRVHETLQEILQHRAYEQGARFGSKAARKT